MRAKACVLPYGIDTKQFRPGSVEAARQRFDIDPHAFVILWPHGDSANKRRDLAEAAVATSAVKAVEEVTVRDPVAAAEAITGAIAAVAARAPREDPTVRSMTMPATAKL